MLHEIVFCLHGFPGDICSHLPTLDAFDESETRLKLISEKLPFIAPSEIGLVVRMHRIGENYLRIQKFIDKSFVPGSGSLYLTALACGLDESLQEYRTTLASLEADLLRTPCLGITYIFTKVDPYRAILSSLNQLLDLSIKHYLNHSCLINCLSLLNKSPVITCVSRHLLRVFRHQLSSWLLFGALHDPYGEFFINPDDTLSPDKFPNIISPMLANDILYAGKAVRSSGSELSDRLEEMFAQRFVDLENTDLLSEVDEGLEHLIRDIWRYVSDEVWRRMFEEFNLIKEVNLVRDVCLLGRGELFVAFLDNLLLESNEIGKDVLERPVPDTIADAKNLSYVVNLAFLASARSVGMDDEELGSQFRFVVSTNPLEENLPPQDLTVCELEGIANCMTAWDCLRLEFISIPAGLETVFTEAVQASYMRLFTFLITVRRTEHALNVVRREAKRNLDQRILLLHHHMAFIVNHLNCYLQIDVIASAFERLLRAFTTHKGGQDLGSVEALHETFLENTKSQAFLHHQRLHYLLSRLLFICRRYRDIDASAAIVAFEHLAATLFSSLSTASQMHSTRLGDGGGGHLSQLLLRLDYNHFFTKSLSNQ